MRLYPQPGKGRPSVEYIPHPHRPTDAQGQEVVAAVHISADRAA